MPNCGGIMSPHVVACQTLISFPPHLVHEYQPTLVPSTVVRCAGGPVRQDREETCMMILSLGANAATISDMNAT